MSNSNPPCLQQEYLDMIQCYKDSGDKLELARNYYLNRYPNRRIPKKHTFQRVVDKFHKNFHSESSSSNSSEQTINPSIPLKVVKILKYFRANPNASHFIASKIFNVDKKYIDMIIRQKDIEISSEEESSDDDTLATVKKAKSNVLPDAVPNQEVPKNKPRMTKKIKRRRRNQNILNKNLMNDKTVKNGAFNPPTSLRLHEVKNTKPHRRKAEDSKHIEKASTPSVYTQRIEDMCIMQKNLKRLKSKDIIKAILQESRPVHLTYCKCCLPHYKKFKFPELKTKLQILSCNNNLSIKQIKRSLDSMLKSNTVLNITLSSDEEVVSESNVTAKRQKKCTVQETGSDSSTANIYENSDMIIVMENKYSKDVEFYCADKGNIREFFIMKDEPVWLQQLLSENYSKIFKFTYCCWYSRQEYIEAIFFHMASILRFLTRLHKCAPAYCECCCAPKTDNDITLDVKLSNASDDTLQTKSKINCSEDSELFYDAVTYKKRKPERKCLKVVHPTVAKISSISFDLEKINSVTLIKESIEINNKGDVVFHTHFPNVSLKAISNDPQLDYNPRICCQSKRKQIISKINDQLSFRPSALKYLQKCPYSENIAKTCSMCMKHEMTLRSREKKVINITVDDFPIVEHMRSCFKPNFVMVKRLCSVSISDACQGSDGRSADQKKKKNEQSIAADDIDDVIDDVLDQFKDIRFIIKEGNTVEGLLSATNNVIPQEYVSKLMRVLKYVKSEVHHVKLFTNTEVALIKNFSHKKYTIAIKSFSIPVPSSINIKIEPGTSSEVSGKRSNSDITLMSENDLKSSSNNRDITSSNIDTNNIMNSDYTQVPQCSTNLPKPSKSGMCDYLLKLIDNNKNYHKKSFKSFLKNDKTSSHDSDNGDTIEVSEDENTFSPKITNVCSLKDTTVVDEVNNVFDLEPSSLKSATSIDLPLTLTDVELDIPSSKITSIKTLQYIDINSTPYILLQPAVVVATSVLGGEGISSPVNEQPVSLPALKNGTFNEQTIPVDPFCPVNSSVPSNPLPDILRDIPHQMTQNSNKENVIIVVSDSIDALLPTGS